MPVLFNKEKRGKTRALLMDTSFICLICSLLYMPLTIGGCCAGFLTSFLLYLSAKIIK